MATLAGLQVRYLISALRRYLDTIYDKSDHTLGRVGHTNLLIL